MCGSFGGSERERDRAPRDYILLAGISVIFNAYTWKSDIYSFYLAKFSLNDVNDNDKDDYLIRT